MIKKSFAIAALYGSVISAFACSNALPTNDVNFCASFKEVAVCYCVASGLPSGMCQDVYVIYTQLIAVFGSIDKACEYQPYTSAQDCKDNWNCFLYGGVDSRQRICSSTRQACL